MNSRRVRGHNQRQLHFLPDILFAAIRLISQIWLPSFHFWHPEVIHCYLPYFIIYLGWLLITSPTSIVTENIWSSSGANYLWNGCLGVFEDCSGCRYYYLATVGCCLPRTGYHPAQWTRVEYVATISTSYISCCTFYLLQSGWFPKFGFHHFISAIQN